MPELITIIMIMNMISVTLPCILVCLCLFSFSPPRQLLLCFLLSLWITLDLLEIQVGGVQCEPSFRLSAFIRHHNSTPIRSNGFGPFLVIACDFIIDGVLGGGTQ